MNNDDMYDCITLMVKYPDVVQIAEDEWEEEDNNADADDDYEYDDILVLQILDGILITMSYLLVYRALCGVLHEQRW